MYMIGRATNLIGFAITLPDSTSEKSVGFVPDAWL
jgi:hypothetical protein